MNGDKGVLVSAILSSVHRCGRDWHLLFFNPQQPHKGRILQETRQNGQMFNFFRLQSSYTKSPPIPLWVLEIPSPKMHEASGPVTMGCFCHSCPVRLTSASNTLSSWDPPVTPEIQMDSDPLKSDGIKVHCAPVSTRALYSWDLTCQAIESTLSNKHGCPFPPPGWRQGPSNPGQRICCSLAVKMTWRFLQEDRNQDQTAYLAWRAGCWKLERHFS